MNLKSVQLRLEVSQVGEILRIVLDDDRKGALDFIKSVLAKKVEKALQRH